jgi:phenol 2-monooxygenase (NADPH)
MCRSDSFLLALPDKEDKTTISYGRATTLWPRTVEMLDQVDLAGEMLQEGVVTTSGMHFHE